MLNPLHWLTAVISFIRSWHPSSDCKAEANRTRKSAFKSIAVLNSVCVYDMAHQPPLYWTLRHHLNSRMVEQDPGEIIELRLWNKLDSVCRTEQPWTPSWAGKVERKSGKRPLRGCICIINKGQTAGLVWLWGLVFRMCQREVLHGQNTLFTNERISQGHFLCFKVLLSSLWSRSASFAL